MSTVRQPEKVSAYLLRCWMEGSAWRYSLEEVGTGKRQGFASLDEFISFMVARSIQPNDREKQSVDVDPKENEANAGVVANSLSCDER